MWSRLQASGYRIGFRQDEVRQRRRAPPLPHGYRASPARRGREWLPAGWAWLVERGRPARPSSGAHKRRPYMWSRLQACGYRIGVRQDESGWCCYALSLPMGTGCPRHDEEGSGRLPVWRGWWKGGAPLAPRRAPTSQRPYMWSRLQACGYRIGVRQDEVRQRRRALFLPHGYRVYPVCRGWAWLPAGWAWLVEGGCPARPSSGAHIPTPLHVVAVTGVWVADRGRG